MDHDLKNLNIDNIMEGNIKAQKMNPLLIRYDKFFKNKNDEDDAVVIAVFHKPTNKVVLVK